MEIDLYQPCPCHAEKKIKFCCGKDVASGLTEVLSQHESRQTAAALDKLDLLIAGNGPRDCLLLARSQLLMALNRLPEAEQSVRQFLATNPTHSLGLERLATILAAQQKWESAWEAMQDAMDNLPDPNVPVAFANGFRYLGLALVSVGYPLAARAHALMACVLERSDPAQDDLYTTIANYNRSLLLQRTFDLPPLPGDAPEQEWNKKYVNAVRAERRGQFRKAIQLVEKALAVAPDDRFLLRAAASVARLRPDYAKFSAAQRRLVACESLTLAERVEAEMLAQFFDSAENTLTIPTVHLVWNVSDMNAVREQMAGSDRMVEMTVPEPDPEQDDGEPPPRAAVAALDRPALAEVTDNINHDDVPLVLAQILVYGRQTNREARLELLLVKDQKFDSTLAWLREQLGAGVVPTDVEQVVSEVSAETHTLNATWHLPENMTRAQHERLTQQRQFYLAGQVLPSMEMAALDGRTLRDAASDPAMAVACQAVICGLELSNDARPWSQEWGREARRAVGLKEIPLVSFDEVTWGNLPSPFLTRYIDLSQLETKKLEQLYASTMYAGVIRGVRAIAPLLLEREDLGTSPAAQEAMRVRLHLSLAELSADDEQCFDHIARARQLLKKSGQPVGHILVREFEQSLLRGKYGRLQPILREIELHHVQEKGVREALTRVLASYGLITPDGQLVIPAEEDTASGESAPAVWTPESAQSAAGGKSGLWIPGQ